MNVELINVSTDKPLSLIGEVAGISYGKTDPKQDRARRCWFNDHMSVFEHVTATWRVTGISRACSHQLVRHRLASYCQKSQRYTKIKGDDWYVVPLSIRCSGVEAHYHGEMRKCREHYDYLLDIGVKPEDARFALPEATKTDIVATMNLREFRNFCELRMDRHAQWEIRNLADAMVASLRYQGGQWIDFVDMLEGALANKFENN